MTSIGKVSFALVSISAFVYLVMQSSSGQQWLENIAQRFNHDSARVQHQEAKQIEKSAKQQDNIKQYERIKHLESQVTSLHHLTAEMKNNLANLQNEINAIVSRKAADALQETQASEQAEASVPQAPVGSSAPVKDFVDIKAKQLKNPRADQDERQRQLAHQARLQDVVQRMEATALKALTR